jgi:hypothetical protein
MKKSFVTGLVIGNYALMTLLSAVLLFEVQPIISKYILPWFGGSPAVWTTCMVFFQTMLFGGYAYAHVSERYLRPVVQAAVHIALICGALALLPIIPDASWKAAVDTGPTWRILCLLSVAVGLPYFVLAATGPLVQAWFCRSLDGRSPYRLYALSNFGSLVALLGYPFYVEPRFAVGQQASLWSQGFWVFAALGVTAAVTAAMAGRRLAPRSAAQGERDESSVCWQQRLAWLAFPALASMMLLATTNHVCQDVAVMPFLWVAPLSLYLLSFIICFDHPRWYWRQAFALAAVVSLGAVTLLDQLITGGSGLSFTFTQELALHFTALFCLCMVCHGELFRLRPDPKHLTSFYLMISAGGALGGMLVSLVAPHVFSSYAEWRLGLIMGCLLGVWVLFSEQPQSFIHRRFVPLAGALLILFAGMNAVPRYKAAAGRELYRSARNFYGVISVVERNTEIPEHHVRRFYSGRIVHGLQFASPHKRLEPTAYFGRTTGVGQALTALKSKPQWRVGVVGLGIGTLAAYSEPGSYFRFYEINADVERFAKDYFSYLSDCRGKCDVVLGDGRLSLESESPQRFDLLVLDAFSGDAVPTHLLTEQAFEIYRKHLNPGSTVAVNISNRYLDLSGVVAGLADRFGFELRRVKSAGDPVAGFFPADWIVLATRSGGVPQSLTAGGASEPVTAPHVLWTDDHSNLFEILK